MKIVRLFVLGMAIFSGGLIAFLSFLYLSTVNFKLDKANVAVLRAQIPKFYVVLSGSMEPELKIGSVAVILPQKNYLENDVVSFSVNNKKDNIVTHRIMAKLYPNGINEAPLFLTAGDANKDFDSNKLEEKQIIGKLLFSVPYLGYLVNFTKQPYGFILLVIVPATIVIYEEILKVRKEVANFFSKKKQPDPTYEGVNS